MVGAGAVATATPTVLIVEDEILISMGLAMALNLAGYRVLGPTGSVKRALDIAAGECPDIALVDINLAGDAEGIGLARALHQRHGTTIVFLTAQPERARQARDVAFGVVGKPYDLDAIPCAIEAAARHRRGEPVGFVPRFLELFC